MRRFLLFALAATLFVACTQDVIDEQRNVITDDNRTLTVSLDGDANDTRIQLNEEKKSVWTKGDLLSVFYRSTTNEQWQFAGKTGDRSGNILPVDSSVVPTPTTNEIVVVYPYNAGYFYNSDTKNVQASLPAEQNYLKDSYGLDGNIMVSQSEYNQVSLKSVCGWLKLQLTGAGETVKSITLRGNAGEQVAGELYINTADATSTLASELTESGDDGEVGGTLVRPGTILTEVTLNCGAGVTLGAEATAFYIALPPQTFDGGITVEISTTDGATMTKSTDSEVVIERNHIQPMTTFVYDGVRPQPNNEIWYTATAKVEPYDKTVFGATYVSNEWNSETGKGVITFDGNVTKIEYYAFGNCDSLTSVTIPDSVTSIGDYAFAQCNSLTSVTIGDSVTTIGEYAFHYCDSLESVTIPDSVTTIGKSAFIYCKSLTSVTIGNSVTTIGNGALQYCDSLTSVTIPNSVTTIGGFAFAGCESLKEFKGKFAADGGRCLIIDGVLNAFALGCGVTQYTIPDSVTTIGNGAFQNCTSLTSVTIPDSVTTIGLYAFYVCTSLTSVNIPDSVTTIGHGAFYECDSLTSVTIPDSVTEIGYYAFYSCDSLTSVTIPDSVTSIGERAFAYCTSLATVYCKPTTPPTGGWVMFDNNATGRRIFVPASDDDSIINAYKAKEYWSDYADYIFEDEPKPLLEVVNNVIDLSFSYSSVAIQVKSNVEYECVIPEDAQSWIRHSKTIAQDEYDNVYIYVSSNMDMSARSATITFKEVEGDRTATATINQTYFEGFDDSALDTSKYLVYKRNHQYITSGGIFDTDIYSTSSYITTGASDVVIAEYKFQLPQEPGQYGEYSLSDNCVRVDQYGIRFYDKDSDGFYPMSSHSWETLGVKSTDVITIRFDNVNDIITVNGVAMNLTVDYTLGSYVFSYYFRISDDGVYKVYGGFMDNAHLYYVKGWDANGRLVYLGYADKATNADGVEEACWRSYGYSGSLSDKKTFSFRNPDGYEPFGMGNM